MNRDIRKLIKKVDEQELAILEIDILTRFGFYPDTITV